MSKVLGIDPALHNVGWAVISTSSDRDLVQAVASGTIINSPKTDLNIRLQAISEQITSIVSQYQPNIIGIETPFIHKGMKANINFIKAYGAIIAACQMSGAFIIEIAPTKIKKTIAGKGSADKHAVSKMLPYLISGLRIDDSNDRPNANIEENIAINPDLHNGPLHPNGLHIAVPKSHHETDAYAIAYCASI